MIPGTWRQASGMAFDLTFNAAQEEKRMTPSWRIPKGILSRELTYLS
jgi:hypothetical protein